MQPRVTSRRNSRHIAGSLNSALYSCFRILKTSACCSAYPVHSNSGVDASREHEGAVRRKHLVSSHTPSRKHHRPGVMICPTDRPPPIHRHRSERRCRSSFRSQEIAWSGVASSYKQSDLGQFDHRSVHFPTSNGRCTDITTYPERIQPGHLCFGSSTKPRVPGRRRMSETD